MSTRKRFDIGTCNEKRNRKCSYSDHFTQAKKEKRRQYTLRSREGTSANESAVLETISPQQKRKTTVIHAKNSEKVPVTTNAKEGAVFRSILPQQKKRRRRQYKLRIRIRYERKRKCSLRDHFTPAKKGRRR